MHAYNISEKRPLLLIYKLADEGPDLAVSKK